MLRNFLLFIIVVFLFVSCKKDSTPACPYTDSTFVVPASELATLKTYVDTYHPNSLLSPDGFYYEITGTGTGTVTPGVCSTVTVKYQGYLTNNNKFDDSNTNYPNGINFTLGGLIPGWQKGIPLIKKGGTINLYLPPSLGYGAYGSGSVPPNAILVFVIQLLDVQ